MLQEEKKEQHQHQCPKCARAFRTKKKLRKHKSKAHREDYDPSKARLEPHTIPATVTTLKVINLYPAGRKSPLGYHPDQLPLARVTYYQGLQKVPDMIVDYNALSHRFPVDVLDFYMRKLELVPKGGK